MAEEMFIQDIADPLDHMNCIHCGKAFDVSGLPMFAPIKCPHCAKPATVPGKMGDFLLLKQLGRGGMAVVFKALDPTLNREVAIKVMRKELGDDPKFVENFLREARAAAQINHPNIVQIYQCGKQKDQPYIVMELVSGGKLDELVAQKGKDFNEKRALRICADAAKGLNAAHEIGLVHGDIKPANILFGKGGISKVADFGLAQFAHKQKTPSGEIWGTPYYIAPEKARRQPEDLRSDIYSLGATMYHVLTGKPPFDGETARDVVLARLKEPPQDILELRDNLQPTTVRVINRMLEADPMRRYPNYKSLLGDLQTAIDEMEKVPGGSTKVLRKSSLSTKKKKAPSSTPIVVAASVVVMLIIGVVLFLASRSDKTGPEAGRPSSGAAYTVPSDHAGEGVAAGTNAAEAAGQPAAAVETQEVAAADAAGGEEAPPPEPLPIQPFDATQDAKLAGMLNRWASSPTLLKAHELSALERDIRNMVSHMPADDPARHWLRILDAMIAALQRDDQRIQAYVDYFNGEVFTSPVPDHTHPGVLPQRLMAVFKGAKPDLNPPSGLENWPAWYLDIAEFLEGVQALYAGNLTQAERSLDNFSERSVTEDVAWPYSLKPAVEHLKNSIGAWRSLDEQMRGLVVAGKHEEVIQKLKPLADRASPIFAEHIRTYIENAQKVLEQRELARKKAEEEARQAKIQEELSVLERWDQTYAGRVREKDFRSAVRALERQKDDLSTPEARKQYEQYMAQCEIMQDMMDFLIESINQDPYIPTRGEFPGKLAGANNIGVTVIIGGGVGMSELRWETVSAPKIFQLMRYYIARRSLDDREQARKLLGLAVFTELSGGRKPAAGALLHALKLDDGLRDRAALMAPELLAEVDAMEQERDAADAAHRQASEQQAVSAARAQARSSFDTHAVTLIKDIQKSDVGKTFTILGKITRVRDVRGGMVCNMQDASRVMEVLVWDRLIDQEARKKMTPGTVMAVRGEVEEYQGTLQLAPGQMTDLFFDVPGGTGGADADKPVAEKKQANLPSDAPSPPAGVTAEPGDGRIVLSWQAAEAGEGVRYNISRADQEGDNPKFLSGTVNTTFTDEKVENGTTYYYVIRTRAKSGEMSAPSDIVSAAPKSAAE